MTPDTIESLLLILFFFLPGYVYKVIRSQFKFQSWDNIEIQLISFIFNSLLFQIIAVLILGLIFKQNVIVHILSTNATFTNFLSKNFNILVWQIFSAVSLAIIFGIATSSKQYKGLVVTLTTWLNISRFFELGIEYVPPISGIMDKKAELGKKMISCVVELISGEYYEGNIKHIGFGNNSEDYIIVLSKVVSLIHNNKKSLPEDMEILIPYSNIKSIIYKTYPILMEQNSNSLGKTKTIKIINILLIFIILVFFILFIIFYKM
jgi:hypothetical protein